MLNISKRFFSKCRPEAKTLRKTLIANYSKHPLGCHCSLCLSKYPLELLDMSHLKPRSVLKHKELRNISNVELMCKTCHSLYDGGIISIDTNGLIVAKEVLEKYDSLIINKYIGSQFQKYSSDNAKFLEWHYTHVFLNIPYKK